MAQWMIGETHFHQKSYELAIEEYLKVEILYDYPQWQAASLLQAGKCYEAIGRWQQAIDLYQRLIERFPHPEFVDDAKRRLSVARQRAEIAALP